ARDRSIVVAGTGAPGANKEQLGAQVWPYVGVNETLDKNDTASINIENDGLGPAVVRNATAAVDGKPKSSFIDVMHTILGPNLIARSHGANISLDLNVSTPGSVLRPGASIVAFALRSKTVREAIPGRVFTIYHPHLLLRDHPGQVLAK
ncbi:MAG: hypothetical protein M3R44_03620, partial [Candidatus Eremiobacteraeota bacterium]|nr:hypothetical protein [Candidatus Eremiobacteraeota bacterium]